MPPSFPFAAIGLWMLASWGPVIWFICAATETVMYLGFPELFGQRSPIVASHVCVIAALRGVPHRDLLSESLDALKRWLTNLLVTLP